ncbi:MAG: hypothetical protein R3C11_28240 [Planctomycetaceae bacterium]
MTPLFGVNGELLGICLGPFLGAWRTGAIGGAIFKKLVSHENPSLALIGTGYQARTQLLAALAVLPLKAITIYGRSASKAKEFCQETQSLLQTQQLDAPELQRVDSIQAAVDGADLVITATKSSTPLLQEEWLTECPPT